MNTLEKILKKEAEIANKRVELKELESLYMKENKRFEKDDVVLVRDGVLSDKYIKAIVIKVNYYRDGKLEYVCSKQNKDGSKRMYSTSYGVISSFRVIDEDDNIKQIKREAENLK